MSRNKLAKRLSIATVVGIAALLVASAFPASATADSPPAANCVTACVATFNTPSAGETIAIPSGITDLSVTVSGGAGAEAPAFAVALAGGAASKGGVTTVDLGTTYAGQTLIVGVGGTGEGSYLQQGSNLLVVAGGGGGAGYGGRLALAGQISSTQAGGDGGTPSGLGSPTINSGFSANVFGEPSVNGGGASGMGGAGGTGSGAVSANGAAGSNTTTTTPAGSTLAAGGAGPTASIGGNTQVAGSGGSGYTGGGSGGMATFTDSDDNPTDVVGGGGGGSGFLAAGLTATGGAGNTGTGSVVLTYSFSPTITTTTTSAHRGDTVPATITGLPATTPFSVTLDGVVVATGTSDGSGGASVTFTVPATQVKGSFPLHLIVGTASVATSDPITVVVALAATGGPDPELPGMAAMLLILAGAGTIMFVRRRRAA